MMFQYKTRTQRKTADARPTPGWNYSLMLKDFSFGEVSKLRELRQRCISGELNEWPADYRRWRFARWLYLNGKIEG